MIKGGMINMDADEYWQRREKCFRNYVNEVRFHGVKDMSWVVHDNFAIFLMQDSVDDEVGVYTALLYDDDIVEQFYIHSASDIHDAFLAHHYMIQAILEREEEETVEE